MFHLSGCVQQSSYHRMTLLLSSSRKNVDLRVYCSIMEEHKMANSDDVAAKSPQEIRRLSIQRCIEALVHACQCRNANCSLPRCQKMKRVMQHAKECERKTNGGCPVCKQLIALCCYHAKHLCQENKCPVPFCLNIKHKLRLRQLQHQLRQARMLRWRMATMQGWVMQNSQHPPAA
ncbi:unnamed protein product [Arctogadus glacialis]